jgi:hypothetical protein
LKANKKFEVLFRRNPGIKKGLRSFYGFFNSSKVKGVLSDEDSAKLIALYQESNKSLKEYLEKQGITSLPSWLK